MLPVIYTTYGVAMGHQPETLANSGGLRPVGAEPMRTSPARVGIARGRRWLDSVLVRMYLWHQDRDVDPKPESTGGSVASTLLSGR
jgi:hypothetical protein